MSGPSCSPTGARAGHPAGLDPRGHTTFAVYWTDTLGIDFAAPLVAPLRAGSVEALVAHELAHAFAHAMQWADQDEGLVNRLVRRWGFDTGQLP
jgi:hypothetical protein